MGGVGLGEGGEVERAVAQEQAEQGAAQEREVAGAPGVAAVFAVLSPDLVAARVVGTLLRPMAAGTSESLAGCAGGGCEGGDEDAGGDGSGLLGGDGALDGEHGGGVEEAELKRGDGDQAQRAVFGAAVGAVVGAKRGELRPMLDRRRCARRGRCP